MAIPQSGPQSAFTALAALNPAQPTPATNGSSSAQQERTFVLLKPAAVKRGLVADISKRFQRRDFSLVAMKMLKPGGELAAKHYLPSKESADFKKLVRAIAEGPVIAMVWKGPDAVSAALDVIGADNPTSALPGTVRGDLALEAAADLIEGAPSAAEAARLAAVWFSEAELSSEAPAPAPAPVAAAPKPRAARSNPVAGQKYYITTAINYANGPPHMGHAYEGVCADVIARYHRAYGRQVFFLTGADEHGQKIADTADKAGVTPLELCDKNVAAFKDLNAKLGVTYDRYIRTTDAQHKANCQRVWGVAAGKGEIYLDVYKGWYNVREETFVTETDAKEHDYKDPVSGVPYKEMEEASYFFRLSKYHAQIAAHIEANPEFIQPSSRRNEIRERLKKDALRDLSVSRTTFSWGIPVPNDAKHVMYVWFDALTNYLSGIEHPDGAAAGFWPCACHSMVKVAVVARP